jgi:ribose transport system permease protein
MAERLPGATISRFLRDYGTLLVLLVLCAVLSVVTLRQQHPTGAAAGRQVASRVTAGPGQQVLVVAGTTAQDGEFAQAAADELSRRKVGFLTVRGSPADARRALETAASEGRGLAAILCTDTSVRWAVFERLDEKFPTLVGTPLIAPQSYYWPSFLTPINLLNIANQIAVIAIVAIGMTMVIVAGGIDLSVGSLIALAAVVAARLIRDLAGGYQASNTEIVLCCLGAIAVAGIAGGISGSLVAVLKVPPFIVTLSMLLLARGLAYEIAEVQTISQVPASINWLGGGAVFGIPHAVILMGILYVIAHLVMSRTTFGRYLYAVGGNPQAAWLCGLPVRRVVTASYAVSGALAGLGGVILASQFKSGAPTYGYNYELQAIAAVVVGGTSLTGGEGKMSGTLLGALIIAVIQNGMNLANLGGTRQQIVLGLVILAAVLLDRLKQNRSG